MSSFFKITESASFSTDLQKEAEAYAEEKRKKNYEVTLDFDYNAWLVKSEFTIMFDKEGDEND